MPDAVLQLVPEIAIVAAAVAIFVAGAFCESQRGWRWIAAGALLAAAAMLATQHDRPSPVGGSLYFDGLAYLGRWLALTLGALLLMMASRPHRENTSEQVGMLLLTVAGLMLAASAGDLVLLFVALELISIPTYVLLYLGRRDAESQESAAKYFFLSVLASAVLLYGFSFLYGAAGSTELSAIRAALSDEKPSPGFAVFSKLAVALIFGGLCFKIAAVPFHFYAPDVYQGTTHPNAALLSVVPKAAGLIAAVRILVVAFSNGEPIVWEIVLAAAVLTMTFGNVVALWQNDLRRLLAYSSIAQAGVMLLALAVALAGGASNEREGVAALGFYLAVYAVATLGAFAVLEYLGRPEQSLDGVDELAGLASTQPAAAGVMAVCMFSLAGVPPLAGFWGKLLVFAGALSVDGANMRVWFIAAAIVGGLNAAVAAAYYLRIVAVMYFRSPLATARAEGGSAPWWAAVACAVLLVGVGGYPGPLMSKARKAVAVEPAAVHAKPQAAPKKPPLQSAPQPGVAATARGFCPKGCPDDLSCSTCAAIIEVGCDTQLSPRREVIPSE